MYNFLRNKLIPFLVLLLLPIISQAEIYRWVDENGKVHFSDKSSDKHEAKKVEVKMNTYEAVTYDTSVFDTGKEVIMYSAVWCGMCKKAKNYFQEKNIKYTEYDIEKSSKGKRDYKKLNGKGVPIILVGKKRMNGFSSTGFEALYE
jgi:glutaredoxin